MVQQLRSAEVGVRFQGLKALEGVSLILNRGEILGLLGPNGAGKTTLVNVLSGFQKPTSGSIFLDDTDVTGLSADGLARRGIARTFQSVRLFRRLSVRENIEVPALARYASRKAARETIERALELAGLSDLAHKQAGSLPYALERLVGIARTLALLPEFVLLDEPAAGMTDGEADKLVELIKRLPGEYGCGVLLIEHNMAVVSTACHNLHVLDGGRTLASGPLETVRNDPTVISAYLGST